MMEHYAQWILLLLLVTVCATQAKRQTSYRAVETGRSVKGETLTEFMAASSDDCSLK